ncbi:MAG: hypothetical protein ACFFF9_05635 [Candidatus Thorarchaeota archaeon]
MTTDLRSRILNLLVREFEYTQALHSEKEDMMRKLGVDDTTVFDEALRELDHEGLITIWIDHRNIIKLAKITWRGINEIGDVKLRYGLEVK